MDSHGEAAHWSLRLVFHTKKRHCLILSIAAAAEQHLRFSHVPASGDFPLPGLCSPRRGGTRGTMNGGSRAASERSGAGRGGTRAPGGRGRSAQPAAAPALPEGPLAPGPRSPARGCQRRARRPGGAVPAPVPTPLQPRSVPVLTGHRAGPAFHSRPSTDQYGGSTGIHFRFRGSRAGHSPGAAPLLAPRSGRGRGAGRGGGTCARSVTGGRGAGGAVPAERWEGCVWPGRRGGIGR